jgi:hypothetical protein
LYAQLRANPRAFRETAGAEPPSVCHALICPENQSQMGVMCARGVLVFRHSAWEDVYRLETKKIASPHSDLAIKKNGVFEGFD